jgi:hypothetical protein
MTAETRISAQLTTIFCCLLLCGCVAGAPKNIAARPESPLEYYAWLLRSTSGTIAAECRRLTGITLVSTDSRHAVWLGLVQLAAPGQCDPDNTAVLDRLNAAIDESKDQVDYQGFLVFAGFLRDYFALLEQVGSDASDKSRMRDEISTLKSDKDRLQQMIDALTTIEQKLIEREQQQVR